MVATTTQDVTANGQPQAGTVPCPDPSAHGHDQKLQNQASKAALYVTHPERSTHVRDVNPLGPDGKLSSASAATSLKHAKPHELPSFPSVGIEREASAGAAASLAHANPKDVQWWKPDASSAASKAATLGWDYKMKPLWQPEASSAGGKAAMLAHKQGPNLNLWQPEASKEGNSAAHIAMKTGKGLSPQLDYGHTEEGKRWALQSAKGAVAGSRNRAGSQPAPPKELYPDQGNAAANALNAASVSHRNDSNRLGSRAMEASRVTHLGENVPRSMFGSAPPVDIEVNEERHQAALHNSAVEMAKKMMAVQANRDTASSGATAAHSRQPATEQPDVRTQAIQYLTLQEQAQKLAAERLAKIGPDEASQYKSYYGYDSPKGRSRLSVRGRNRKRASSEGNDSNSDDEEQARRIRSQMAQLRGNMGEVDLEKRKKDRQSLMAAAEKKVHAQMHSMDEKVFNDTGKMSPAMTEEWEAKARARATKDSEERMQHHGKVSIGGGKYLDQSEINAIAAARIQPTLDEVTETAEKRRARDEEIRLDQEQKKREMQTEKERERERKADEKRVHNEEKQAEKQKKAEEKAAQKTEKEAEKARKAEEKKLAREDKRRSRETKSVAAGLGEAADKEKEPEDETADIAAPTTVVATTYTESEHDAAKEQAVQEQHDKEEASEEQLARETSGEGAPLRLERRTTQDLMQNRDVAAIEDSESDELEDDEVLDEPTAPATTIGPVAPGATGASATKTAVAVPASEPLEPTSPISPTSTKESKGFRSLLGKLKRRSKPVSKTSQIDRPEQGSFSGGHSLTGQTSNSVSGTSNPRTVESKTSDPAIPRSQESTITTGLAEVPRPDGTPWANQPIVLDDFADERGRSGRPVDDVSDEDEGDEFEDAEEGRDAKVGGLMLEPPKREFDRPVSVTGSPVRETRFQEAL